MAIPLDPTAFPTTKILALGTVNASLTPDQQRDNMPQEVSDTVRLYLAGKIDQWFGRPDGKGVVFILNVTSVEEAHELLASLPLGQEKLMSFELIALGPLFPLSILLSK